MRVSLLPQLSAAVLTGVSSAVMSSKELTLTFLGRCVSGVGSGPWCSVSLGFMICMILLTLLLRFEPMLLIEDWLLKIDCEVEAEERLPTSSPSFSLWIAMMDFRSSGGCCDESESFGL